MTAERLNDQNADEIVSELLDMAAIYCGPIRRSTAASRLFHDLGLSGEDAIDYLHEVFRRYGVRSEGFRFDEYFPDEAEGAFVHLLSLLSPIKRWWKELTVEHLVKVCMSKRWFDPQPRSVRGTSAEPAA